MSALKSKDIKDYFEASFNDIRPEDPITFDIFLYFAQNSHVILWIRNGEALSKGFLNRYQNKGIQKIWIYTAERDAFQKYCALDLEPLFDPDPPPPPKTEEGQAIAQAIQSPELPKEEKESEVSKKAKEVIDDLADAKDMKEQQEKNEKAKKIVRDILHSTMKDSKGSHSEVWNVSNIDSEFKHAVNVATYSVLFSMAFGRIDPELLSDIAAAGLYHDLGLSQIPSNITSKPVTELSGEELKLYQKHVDQTLKLIDLMNPDISERVKATLMQHHEKFNGKGYPKALEGFQFDDVAQLVAIADLTDTVSSGQWDGQERTFRDAFEVIQGFEQKSTFPEYFNPEVFSQVKTWIKSDRAKDAMVEAAHVVSEKVKSFVDKKPKESAA